LLACLGLAAAARAGADADLCLAGRCYVGFQGGLALGRNDASALDSELQQQGFAVHTQVQRTSGSYGGYLGYWLAPRIGLELGLAQLGSHDVQVAGGNSADIPRIAAVIRTEKPPGGRAEYLQARFEAPLAPDWAVSSQLGLFFLQDHGRLDTPSASSDLNRNCIGGIAGIDGSWQMLPALYLRAGWQLYWPTRADLLHVFHAGFEYRFGY
jgi:hypothetical protein